MKIPISACPAKSKHQIYLLKITFIRQNFGKNSGRTIISSIKGQCTYLFTCLRKRAKLSRRMSQYLFASAWSLVICTFNLKPFIFSRSFKHCLFTSSPLLPANSAKRINFENRRSTS